LSFDIYMIVTRLRGIDSSAINLNGGL